MVLFHPPALRWISLLEMTPARGMMKEGKLVLRQIAQLKRLHCVWCLRWKVFPEWKSCSVSCRKKNKQYTVQMKTKQKPGRIFYLGWKHCYSIIMALRGLITLCTLCLLGWVGKHPFFSYRYLWVLSPSLTCYSHVPPSAEHTVCCPDHLTERPGPLCNLEEGMDTPVVSLCVIYII